MPAFSLAIDKFIAKANAAPAIVVRKVATDLLSSIVYATPVGNTDLWKTKYPPKGYAGGRARANWNVSLNRIDATVSVTTFDKNGAPTITRGLASINQWQPNDTIWIASGLPYITALEYGHSTQSLPHAMVRLNVMRFQNFIDAAVRSLPNK